MHFRWQFSRWVWGTFMLLAAAFIVANQFGGFVQVGVGSLIVTVLAVAFLVECIAKLSFAAIPIPLAVLYIVYQSALELPYLSPWTLILAAVLMSIGIATLIPKKFRRTKILRGGKDRANVIIHSEECHAKAAPEENDADNNPSVSVQFGAVSRYLHADCLESAQLHCNFGAMEVFFDQAQLSPEGAQVNVSCSFGAVELFVPRHWRIIDKTQCSVGGVEVDSRFASAQQDAPTLTLTGSVSFGGIEVKYV